MIYTHLKEANGVICVKDAKDPNGETKWVHPHELIEMAGGVTQVEAPKEGPATETPREGGELVSDGETHEAEIKPTRKPAKKR